MWKLVVLSVVFAAGSVALSFPADVAISGGRAVNHVCGVCCQANAFCGSLIEEVQIYDVNGNSLTVPKRSSLTCMLRDRSAFGAVDGGLCVPSSMPTHFDIADMCRLHDKTLPVSHTLSAARVVYQSGLVPQEPCGACYDGYHFCEGGTVCRRPAANASGSREGICVPSDTTESACGQLINMTDQLHHESCDKATPAAELYEQQHSLPFRRRLQATGTLVSHSSRRLLQANTDIKPMVRNLLAASLAASPAAPITTPSASTPSPTAISLTKTIPSATPAPGATKPASAPTISQSAPAPSASKETVSKPSSVPSPAKSAPAPAQSGRTAIPSTAPSPAPTPKASHTPTPTPKPTGQTPAATSKSTPAPTPKTTPRWTPYAFAPSSGGGQAGWCNKNLDCALPQYNMCKKGKCVKKPGYCESYKHCKAGYECKEHFCAKKKQASTTKQTSGTSQKQ